MPDTKIQRASFNGFCCAVTWLVLWLFVLIRYLHEPYNAVGKERGRCKSKCMHHDLASWCYQYASRTCFSINIHRIVFDLIHLFTEFQKIINFQMGIRTLYPHIYIYISKFRKQPLSNTNSIKHYTRFYIDKLLVQLLYSSY